MSGRASTLPIWFLCGIFLVVIGVFWRNSTAETNVMGEFWAWPMAAGIVVMAAVPVVWLGGRGSSTHTVNRWSRNARRNGGVASRSAILATSSPLAMRRQAAVLRPSLADSTWWQRFRTPIKEIATPVAKVGWQRIWATVEEVTVRIGGPRSGKTGELCCRILDAPGAVIATSTRTDLIEHTAVLRADRGPVHVFNPSGVGGLASSVSFDPLRGCHDPATAAYRAADLLAVTSNKDHGADREFWDVLARGTLATLMHAAALGEQSMHDVLGWVANPSSAAKDIQTYLRWSPEPAWQQQAAQFLDTNDRTQSSICATIMPALSWLNSPTAVAAADPERGIDVTELLESRGTVYMLGAEEAHTAPLVTAFTGHIAREARRLAAVSKHGRLDPPLTLALDEAALICPIPLDSWTADMGGRGVTIHIAAQSRAQLRKRWGDNGAGAILNNAAVLMLLGGLRDADDLSAFSALTGERDDQAPTFGTHGQITGYATRRVPVLSAGEIAQLPAKHVVIVRRGMPTAVGRLEMVWARKDYRAMQRERRRAPAPTTWRPVRQAPVFDFPAPRAAEQSERSTSDRRSR